MRGLRNLSLFLSLGIVAVAPSCNPRSTSQNRNASPQESVKTSNHSPDTPCVNLNAASIDQLTELPGVGEVIARRIVAYRERNGPYRRKEDVIIIEGFSEGKYHAIADRICVE